MPARHPCRTAGPGGQREGAAGRRDLTCADRDARIRFVRPSRQREGAPGRGDVARALRRAGRRVVDTTPTGVPAPVATTAGPAAGVPVALIGVARTDALAPAPGLTTVCVLSGSPAPVAMGVVVGVTGARPAPALRSPCRSASRRAANRRHTPRRRGDPGSPAWGCTRRSSPAHQRFTGRRSTAAQAGRRPVQPGTWGCGRFDVDVVAVEWVSHLGAGLLARRGGTNLLMRCWNRAPP